MQKRLPDYRGPSPGRLAPSSCENEPRLTREVLLSKERSNFAKFGERAAIKDELEGTQDERTASILSAHGTDDEVVLAICANSAAQVLTTQQASCKPFNFSASILKLKRGKPLFEFTPKSRLAMQRHDHKVRE